MSSKKHTPLKRDKLSNNIAKCVDVEIVVNIPCHPDDAFDKDIWERHERFTDRICACYNACAGMEDPVAEIERLKKYGAPEAGAKALSWVKKPCQKHDQYWTTCSGACMACRAEDAEKKAAQWKATHGEGEEGVKHFEYDERCPAAIVRMAAGILDQCAKGQYFNATHRLLELQCEVSSRLQRAVNNEPGYMDDRPLGRWGVLPLPDEGSTR